MSDLDPNAFLQSVRELKEKREKEDKERNEQLEAQILRDRELRQARKLERERSLSPEKTTPQSSRFGRENTPVNAPHTPSRTSVMSSHNPSRNSVVSSHSPTRSSAMSTPRQLRPESPASLDRSPSPPKAAPGLSRSGTMSWQKRPGSISVRSRPLSVVASENSAARSPQRQEHSPQRQEHSPQRQEHSPQRQEHSPQRQEHSAEDAEDRSVSRDSISQSLATKDPAWFRQTADRGIASPAYRSNRDDIESEATLPKKQLPGMESAFPKRPFSIASASDLHKTDRESTMPAADTPSLPSPTRGRPVGAYNESTNLARTMSNAQTRLTTSRPVSPTKGMGGFVQSALLKRSDSVSRWTAQPPPSTIAHDHPSGVPARFGSIRDSAMAASRSMPRLDQLQPRAQSPSRPNSSHRPSSAHTITNHPALGPDTDSTQVPAQLPQPLHHSHSRSKSVASLALTPDAFASPPLTPSRRWSRSPTKSKSSWLESALARPESPKPSLQSNQPTWMADLAKAKQQRVNGEPGTAVLDSPLPKSFMQDEKPSWMAEVTKAKEQRSSGQHTLSQDTLDAAKAQSIPKRSDEPVESVSAAEPQKPTSIAVRDSPARNFTPPTKAKPAALSSRPASLDLKPKADGRFVAAEPIKTTARGAQSVAKDASPSLEASQSVRAKGLSSPFMSPSLGDAATMPRAFTSPKAAIVSPRPKPETPPKKDFRSALKARADTEGAPAREEPEFKAVFGKLKRAQTEKYVAPDELKNNILRGKAGLSLSEGPQKRERKDELKESLIRKKEEIKTKREIEPPAPKISPTPSQALPEALAIRRQLGRSGSTLNVAQPERQRRDVTPEALSLHRTLRGKARAPSPDKPLTTTTAPPERSLAAAFSAPIARAIPQVEQPAPLASSKLANRFNPALANILARGPPSSAPSPRSSSPVTNITPTLERAPANSDESTVGATLTHMTKSRAKGPKRRKPNTKSVTADETSTSTGSLERPKSEDNIGSPTVAKMPQPPPKSAKVRVASLRLSSGSLADRGDQKLPAPVEAENTNENKVLGRSSVSTTTARAPSALPSLKAVSVIKSNGPVAISTPDAAIQDGADKENQTSSVKNAASLWGKPAQRVVSRSSPIHLPTKKDEEAAMKAAGLLSESPTRQTEPASPRGLGISTSGTKGALNGARSPSSSGPPKPPKSSRVVSASLSSRDLRSLTEIRATKAGRCLYDYFGDIPTSNAPLRLDTQAALMSRPGASGKIKTLRKSIHELTGDGKMIPMPAQEEHILYEDSMYVCTHVYGSAGCTKVTEVYLWSGLGVSESAIQDAQIFAKRIAKEAGVGQKSTQLLIIDQNREPAAFFQALGGIVIIRRGSRARNIMDPYMLCGRPHLGHVAFDEVELSKASLCSDFPYIVARPVTLQETKIYLWRGRSCGDEAIGAARLIGMDLSPLGDIIEVDEGLEPQDLLLLMSDLSSDVCSSPELWSKTQRRWDNSAARLFRFSASSPKLGAGLFSSLIARRPSWPGSKDSPPGPLSPGSPTSSEAAVTVKEISPFTQADLEPEGCFVLDCGHLILVLPGPLLSKQQLWQQAFTQCLLFAHDYLILAASLEDRPAIPGAGVVLAGLPRDAELRFRHFDKSKGVWGTEGMMAGRRLEGMEETDVLDIREVLELCCRI